jgi:hypothetical protein
MTARLDVHRLKRRKLVAELLMMLCGVFAFAWIAAALVLIWRDATLRPATQVLWQLWPLVPVPLCGFGVTLWWRTSLARRLEALS